MTAAEWLYPTWSRDAGLESSRPPLFSEWVDTHAADEFENHAEWLRERLDRYGPQLPPHGEKRVRPLFCGAVRLAIAFHDEVYS
jgi:thiaminase/transcriptional activator TenA